MARGRKSSGRASTLSKIARRGTTALVLGAWLASPLLPQDLTAPPTEPKLLSVYPLGAQPGSSVEMEVRGYLIEGARAVWLEQGRLRARVRSVEPLSAGEKAAEEGVGGETPVLLRARITMEIPSTAKAGAHSFRLVSHRGVSNALIFRVNSDPVQVETNDPHQTPTTAQLVKFPVVVNGRIAKDGEEDFYSFEVSEGQELRFEVFSKPPGKPPNTVGLDPELTLYELTGSWFDRERTTRLAYNDEPSSYHVTRLPVVTYRFKRSGRYLVGVGSFLGGGSPHYSYQLRIASSRAATFSRQDQSSRDQRLPSWSERTFRRHIASDRLQLLRSRAAGSSLAEANGKPRNGARSGRQEHSHPVTTGRDTQVLVTPVKEQESQEKEGRPLRISVPSLVEGSIDRPGDVDRYEFKVERGEQLAFEIETPQTGPPLFNPRLSILDAEGKEIFTNVYKRLGRAFTFYLKTVEPKTLYTFERGGEYVLLVSDLTRRFGDSGFRYRLLVRPQIPHVGAVRTEADCLNLVPGQAKKLTVTTDQEEGFSGDIALALEGLPEGVQFFPGTEVKAYQGPVPEDGEKQRFAPKSENVTIVLLARPDAPTTLLPWRLRLVARPILNGGPGPGLLVKEIPIMVVRSSVDMEES